MFAVQIRSKVENFRHTFYYELLKIIIGIGTLETVNYVRRCVVRRVGADGHSQEDVSPNTVPWVNVHVIFCGLVHNLR